MSSSDIVSQRNYMPWEVLNSPSMGEKNSSEGFHHFEIKTFFLSEIVMSEVIIPDQ